MFIMRGQTMLLHSKTLKDQKFDVTELTKLCAQAIDSSSMLTLISCLMPHMGFSFLALMH
jgi:hypothetical protein